MGSGVYPLAKATRSSKREETDAGYQLSDVKRLFWHLSSDNWQPTTSEGLTSAELIAARDEKDQADRAISTGQLHVLPRFHTRPIDVVVFHGSQARPGFEVGFPLRCFQRLSRPHIATRLCGWRHNRSTRGASIPVLSY